MKNNPSETYIEEAMEILNLIENQLVILEKKPDDKDILNNIFREYHTIKGSGAMFGFDRIVKFTHKIESLFDEIRKDKLKINKKIIDLTLSSCDLIRSLLLGKDSKEIHDEENRLNNLLKKYIDEKTFTEIKKEIEEVKKESGNILNKKIYRIIFKPSKDIFLHGVNPILMINELSELGDCYTVAEFKHKTQLTNLDVEECNTDWIFILTTECLINTIKDIFIFVDDYCKVEIDIIDEESDYYKDFDYKKIGEVLLDRKDLTVEELKEILKEKGKFGEIALEKGIISKEQLDSALIEQQIVREERQKRNEVFESTTIRVKHKKLDDLVNLVGELVTLQARLSQFSSLKNDSDLDIISERFNRLISDLRDNTMSMRMLPIAITFNSFYRLVRDLSSDMGKEIELEINGADTELDKNMIDLLKDPLMHIIRNCIDHGIESPKERKSKKKDIKGKIILSAEYSGANVLIKISDDGKGMDIANIKKVAVKKGLIYEKEKLTDKEIVNLIFLPGFSTAEKATRVSGRGVGMDVVKKNIEKLRGYIEVETIKDIGTAITLRIPLTLAIIDGLLVEISNNFYIINLSAIDECIDLTENILPKKRNRDIINLRNEMIPFIDLRKLFEINGDLPEIEQLVITNVSNFKIGIKVDNVIGQHQTVIKTLGRVYKDIEEISGVTILGDGSIALILDVNKIAERLENEKILNK